MICNHYKFGDSDILVYGEKDFEIPEYLKFELKEKNVDPSREDLKDFPIFRFDLLLLSTLHKRNRENILDEEKIISYSDLASAYFLIKIKSLRKSKRVRELVFEKYTEILNLIDHEHNRSNQSD